MESSRKKALKRVIIVITAFVLIFSSPQDLITYAVSMRDPQTQQNTFPETSELPEATDYAEFVKNGCLCRLPDREKDLNSLVFQNEDGTKTLYYFSEAVKYIDDDGKTHDKSTVLSSVDNAKYNKEYKYCSIDNDVRTYYPKSLNVDTGVVLDYEEIHIEQLPMVTNTSGKRNKAQKNKNSSEETSAKESVSYNDVFGVGTEIRYMPTFSGFKEDIVLDYYNGINEFSFTIRTNGLNLVEHNGTYFLSHPGSDVPVVNIGELLINDSSIDRVTENKKYNHYYRIHTIRKNEEYRITIVVDPSYLTSETTVFPVTIDPSFEISSSNNGIMDISVDPSGNVTKSTALSAGWSEYYQKNYRTFVKFPGLLDSWQWASLQPYGFGSDVSPEITNLSLNLYNVAIDFESTYIDAYQYYGTNAVDWSYTQNGTSPATFTTANYNAKGQFASSTVIDCNAGWKSFDLTSIDAFNLSKGIVLQNRHEGTNFNYDFKQFHSTRNTNYKPVIAVTWIDVSNTSFQTAKTASLNTDYDVTILGSNVKHYYSFTPTNTGFYTIESSGIVSGDPYCRLYNSTQAQISYNDDGGVGRNFRIIYHLDAAQQYFIEAGCYNTGIGCYSFRISANTSMTNITSANTLIIGATQSVQIINSRERKIYSFTAPESKTYYFASSGNGTTDPKGWLYNSNAVLLASNDDGAGSRNFRIACTLTANQTVYLVTGCYNTGTGNYSVSVKPESITGQINQQLNSGDYLSIPFVITNTSDLNHIVFSINYSPTDFELADACELSTAPVLSTGIVSGTNINITEISENKVSFITTNTTVPTGVVNIIKLRSKRTGTLIATYSASLSYN